MPSASRAATTSPLRIDRRDERRSCASRSMTASRLRRRDRERQVIDDLAPPPHLARRSRRASPPDRRAGTPASERACSSASMWIARVPRAAPLLDRLEDLLLADLAEPGQLAQRAGLRTARRPRRDPRVRARRGSCAPSARRRSAAARARRSPRATRRAASRAPSPMPRRARSPTTRAIDGPTPGSSSSRPSSISRCRPFAASIDFAARSYAIARWRSPSRSKYIAISRSIAPMVAGSTIAAYLIQGVPGDPPGVVGMLPVEPPGVVGGGRRVARRHRRRARRDRTGRSRAARRHRPRVARRAGGRQRDRRVRRHRRLRRVAVADVIPNPANPWRASPAFSRSSPSRRPSPPHGSPRCRCPSRLPHHRARCRAPPAQRGLDACAERIARDHPRRDHHAPRIAR